MVCSGAAEQAMAQWASLFAENGLGISKTLGDLFGPCLFAIMMGVVRTLYGIKGQKINIQKILIVCSFTGNVNNNTVLGSAAVLVVVGLISYIVINKNVTD